jgi:hypothetical protein
MKLVGYFGNGARDDSIVETNEEEGEVQAEDDEKEIEFAGILVLVILCIGVLH